MYSQKALVLPTYPPHPQKGLLISLPSHSSPWTKHPSRMNHHRSQSGHIDKKKSSISQTLQNIHELLEGNKRFQGSSNTRSTSKSPLQKPKIVMSEVIKDVENLVNNHNRKMNQGFTNLRLNLNKKGDDLTGKEPQARREVTKTIFMPSGKNILVNIRDIKGNIDQLAYEKNREKINLEMMSKFEKLIEIEITKNNYFFKDQHKMPLRYINESENRRGGGAGFFKNEMFFAVKSHNNYIMDFNNNDMGLKEKSKTRALQRWNSQRRNSEEELMQTNIRKLLKVSKTSGFQTKDMIERSLIKSKSFEEEDEYDNYDENVDDEPQEKVKVLDEDEIRENEIEIKKKRILLKLEKYPGLVRCLWKWVTYFDSGLRYSHKRKKSVDFGEYVPPDFEKRVLKNVNSKLKKEIIDMKKDWKRHDEERENQELCNYTVKPFVFTNYVSEIKKIGLMVGADEEMRSLGEVTHAATIEKRIKMTSNFHPRWMVLRGFNLYWYRTAEHKTAKGVIPLPSSSIKEDKIQNKPVFHLSESEEEKGQKRNLFHSESLGRMLTFINQGSGAEWRKLLANQIAYKGYIEYIERERLKPSKFMIDYFNNRNTEQLYLCDLGFKRKASQLSAEAEVFEEKIIPLVELVSDSLVFHVRLRELNMSRLGIGNKLVKKIMEALVQTQYRLKLERLILDNNYIKQEGIESLREYLHHENSAVLDYISLNFNDLFNDGVRALMEIITSRHNKFGGQNKKYCLPLLTLNLVQVRMSDQGLFSVVSCLDKIHKSNKARSVWEYSSFLTLNISENLFTDNSVKNLCLLLAEFNGICSLDISKCKKLRGTVLGQVMDALKKNYSLKYLNYESNETDLPSFYAIFDCLEENNVIQHVKVTVPEYLYEQIQTRDSPIYRFFKISEIS